ncbi:MAG: lysophospholipid acyltransferase family protein [Kiritimatiellaeota bacterium]|nr:lysophospholipid acyltransferase family protein [Kiritimatiellota bacterium]
MPKKKRKSSSLIYLEYVSTRILAFIVRLLPLRICYLIGRGCARLFYLFDVRHRRRTIAHLLLAGVAADEREARRMARANFAHFGEVAVEILKMKQYLTPESVRGMITPTGSPEAVEMFFTSKTPAQCIVVTGHYGNWEIAGMGYSLLCGNPLLTVMRPFDNPKIGEYVYKQREGFNHRICPKEGALKSLMGALRKGESVCIISDQHTSTTEGVVVDFFGREARTTASPAMLHLKTKVPILVSVSKRVGEMRFEFVCADPVILDAPSGDKEKDILEITQRCSTALENLIKDDPAQWLWAHRRWLETREKYKKTKAGRISEAN